MKNTDEPMTHADDIKTIRDALDALEDAFIAFKLETDAALGCLENVEGRAQSCGCSGEFIGHMYHGKICSKHMNDISTNALAAQSAKLAEMERVMEIYEESLKFIAENPDANTMKDCEIAAREALSEANRLRGK